jgi:phage gp29-like protein
MKKNLLNEFASRERMEKYIQLYQCLPDPDRILCENGYDYSILRDLLNDAHLIAAVQQRKMQIIQMGWSVEADAINNEQLTMNNEVKERAIELMRNLPLSEIMNGILDAILFGFSVGEIEWKMQGKEIIPINVINKPQEWFIYNTQNELRLRKMSNGSYLFEEGVKLPDYKFIVSQHHPSFTNPYGEKVLSRCYWPVIFKRGGIEFWQLMMERFGMPYLIGRYSTGATAPEKEALLDDLKQMVKDSISVFEEGKEIEIKEAPSYDVGQLYEKLVQFHNKEISKAILTVTLTTEIERTGSYKASEIHKEMLSYLGSY